VPLNEALRQIEALLQAGRYAEAEKLGQALRLRPGKSAQAAYLLGMAVLLQGRPEDAVPHLRRAVEHDGAMAPALYNLGFALERLERLDEALAAYRRTLAAAPNLADAHNNLGNVLQKLGRHDEALTAFEKAAALRPDAAVFQMNRAMCCANWNGLKRGQPPMSGRSGSNRRSSMPMANWPWPCLDSTAMRNS